MMLEKLKLSGGTDKNANTFAPPQYINIFLSRRVMKTCAAAVLCALSLAAPQIARAQNTPAVPENLRLDAVDNAYDVTWEFDFDSVSGRLSFRIIARNGETIVTEEGEDGQRFGGGGQVIRRIEFDTDRNGETHEVQIRACRGNGIGNCSEWSPPQEIIVGGGGTPQDLFAAPTNGGFRATWSPSENTGAVALTGYEIRFAEVGATFPAAGNPIGLVTQHAQEMLTAGTEYQVQVAGVSEHGRGFWTRAVTATPGALSAPLRVLALTRDRGLQVFWDAPMLDANDSAVDAYQVRWKRADAAGYPPDDELEPAFAAAQISYTINNLVNNQRYDVQVRARNMQGKGEWSPPSAGLPLPPQDDWTLRELTINQGELSPPFNPPITNYTVTLPADATFFSGTLIRNNPLALVRNNFKQTLQPGSNAVVIDAYSPNNVLTQYRIQIIRGELRDDDASPILVQVRNENDGMMLGEMQLGGATRTYTLEVPFHADDVHFQIHPEKLVEYVRLYVPPQDGLEADGDEVIDDNAGGGEDTEPVHLAVAETRIATIRLREIFKIVEHVYEVHLTRAAADATSPAVSFDTDYYEVEEGASVKIPVQLSSPALAGGASVTYTLTEVVEDDESPLGVNAVLTPPSPLEFAEGEVRKNITVSVPDDDFGGVQILETRLTLSVPDGYQAGVDTVAEVDIYDDEISNRNRIAFGGINSTAAYTAPALNEGDAITLPVRIESAAVSDLVFAARASGSAQEGVDFVFIEPLAKFPARGGLESEIRIRILDDAAIEEDETIELMLIDGNAADAGLEVFYRLGNSYPRTFAMLHINASDHADDAKLSALKISAGELLPAFAPETESYVLRAVNTVAEISVTPSLKELGASVAVNGGEVFTGHASDAIALDEGVAKNILIVATARDGETMMTYKIAATRAAADASADASLNNLVVTAGQTMLSLVKTGADTTDGFAATHLSYAAAAEVAHTFSQITFAPEAADSGARFSINGGAELQHKITHGENKFAIVVTAQNEIAATTYSLNIARAAGVPDAPQNLRMYARNSVLWLQWWPPVSDNGAAVTTYLYRLKEKDADDFIVDDNIESVYTKILLDELQNGREYDFEVAALNAIGAGPWSAVSGALHAGIAPPDMPAVQPLIPIAGGLRVVWTARRDTGGPADGFKVRWRMEGGANPWQKSGGDTDDDADGEDVAAREYDITGLDGETFDGAYQVQVAAENSAGIGEWSESQRGFPQRLGEILAPHAPHAAALIPGNRALTLMWSGPFITGGAEILDYRVRWRMAGEDAWQKVSGGTGDDADGESVAALAYTIADLTAGVTFETQIAARNAAGVGAWSISRFGVPEFVPEISASGGDGVLILSWAQPSADAGVVNGYRARWRVAGGGGDWQKVSGDTDDDADGESVASPPYTIMNLQNGIAYDAQVAAETAAGFGAWSAIARAEPGVVPVAPPPPSLTAAAGEVRSGKLILSWSPPVNENNPAILDYRVRWRVVDTADWKKLAGATDDETDGETADALSYTITNLENGVTHEAQVAARNAIGVGAWSDSASGAPQGPLTAPGAPTVVLLVSGAGTLTPEWSPPADSGGEVIENYRVRWRAADDGGGMPGAWQKSGGATDINDDADGEDVAALDYTISGLAGGATFEIQILALNSAGAGDWSGIVRGRALGLPGAPQVATILPGDAQLKLSWLPPADDGGAEVLDYRIRWRLADDGGAPGAWQKSAGATDAADDSDGETVAALDYMIANLNNGSSYQAQVAARNVVGVGEWSAARLGVPKPAFNLNVDNAGEVTWEEGVMIVRYLLGMRGPDLTAGLSNVDADMIAGNIASGFAAGDLDVNQDGKTTTADGILIARYLLGVTSGDGLTAGQVQSKTSAETDAVNAIIKLGAPPPEAPR